MLGVAIVTADRPVSMLQAMLRHYADTGLPVPRVIPDIYGHGPCRTWQRSLAFLLQSRCDRFLLLEDDARLSKNVGAYLETTRFCGVSTLWTPQANHTLLSTASGGWHKLHSSRLYGALGLLMPRYVAEELADITENYPGADVMVSHWCRRSGVPVFGHNPSLIWHMGAGVSADGDVWERNGYMQCAQFCKDAKGLMP